MMLTCSKLFLEQKEMINFYVFQDHKAQVKFNLVRWDKKKYIVHFTVDEHLASFQLGAITHGVALVIFTFFG